MTIDEILINAGPGETRIALLNNGQLIELQIDRDGGSRIAGNVYLGRVETVVGGIQAAFVDIGLERSGFLALPEARPPGIGGEQADRLTDYVTEGDSVLVQILAEPYDDKGAKLTKRVTLPGRHLVLTPEDSAVRVSRRIGDDEDRNRLQDAVQGLADERAGFVVRTEAAQASEDELSREAGTLNSLWDDITDRAPVTRPPMLMHAEADAASRVLRDYGGAALRRVAIDDGPMMAGLKKYCQAWMPAVAEQLEHWTGPSALFGGEIEEQIDQALSPSVPLAGGGSLVIAETTAFVAIDVNTGGIDRGGREETAFEANLQAAAEIARQARLRNLNGLLVADLVPMKNARNKSAVLDALRAALDDDPVPSHVVGYTKMGLLEITRRRQRASLKRSLMEACGACGGDGWIKSPETVAYEALRGLLTETRLAAGRPLGLRVAPGVADAFSDGGPRKALDEAAETLGHPVSVEADSGLAPDGFRVEPLTDKEV